jgi:hypothetical protein
LIQSVKKFLDIVDAQLIAKKSEAAGQTENGHPAIDIFEMANKSVNAFIDAQQRLLDLASEQIDVDVKFARDMFSVETHPTTALADLAKKSVDSFVAAQRALTELASKPREPVEAQEEKEEENEPEVVPRRPKRRTPPTM